MTDREAGVLRDTGCREVLGDEWVVLWLSPGWRWSHGSYRPI